MTCDAKILLSGLSFVSTKSGVLPGGQLNPVRSVAGLAVLTAAIAAVGQLAVETWPSAWPAVSAVAVLAVLSFVYVVRMVGTTGAAADPDTAAS